jgi:hypothetical protein
MHPSAPSRTPAAPPDPAPAAATTSRVSLAGWFARFSPLPRLRRLARWPTLPPPAQWSRSPRWKKLVKWVKGKPVRRRKAGTLGVFWCHGSFCAAVHKPGASGPVEVWRHPAPVNTPVEFEAALDFARAMLGFNGIEVFLVLGHAQLTHEPEPIPALHGNALRAYLRAQVALRKPPPAADAQAPEPSLWVCEPAAPQRQERAVLLHVLDGELHARLHRLMTVRRLELVRIVPPTVPLQLALESLPEAKEAPVLVAAPAGHATTVVVGQAGRPVLLARTMRAAWRDDPARLAVELNRTLLYVRQQCGVHVARVRLLGDAPAALLAEVHGRCGRGLDVGTVALGPAHWLASVAALPARHPVNLVAGHLGDRLRRRFARRLTIAACGLFFVFTALDTARRTSEWQAERTHWERLAASLPGLEAERTRLEERNARAMTRATWIGGLHSARGEPVPARFLAWTAAHLPAAARLTSWQVRAHEAMPGWSFRFEGTFDASEEEARELLDQFARQLGRSPFRARLPETGRALIVIPPTALHEDAQVRFVWEGGLGEN